MWCLGISVFGQQVLENLSYCWRLASSLVLQRANANEDEWLIGSFLGMCWWWAMDKTRIKLNIGELKYLKHLLNMAVVRPEHQ